MTVQAGPTEKRYAANGVSTIYTIPFLLINASDLQVFLNGVLLTSGYTLTGIGNPESTATFSVAPSGDLYFVLNVPFERLIDYQENGDFLAKTVNSDFDRIWQALKQLYRGSTRALTLGSLDVDGSGNYRAKNNGIADLRDPVNNQDATTKSWVLTYLATLLGQIQGPINNALNIFMTGADGLAHVVQDLATSIGAYMTGYKARSVGRRLEEQPSLLDQTGVVANSLVADNLTQVNASIAAGIGGKVWLSPGIFRLSGPPTNPRGVEFSGPGGIALPALGGLRQISKYADKHKYAIGHEYLGKVYKRLEIDGQLTVHLHGDSTMAGGNGESAAFSTASIIRTILANKGLSNVNVINYAVGGTRFNDVPAQLHIDATAGNSTDLLIIKDGINDMGTGSPTRIEDMTTALDNLLGGIRAGTNGSLDKLSIILMGPNATNDIPNGRDEKAYEQLRGIFVAAARKHQVCFIDVYAYLNDCWGMANFTMDSPFPANPVIAIHPLNVMQTMLWGFILDYAFGFGETRIYAKNNVQNSGAASGVPPANTPATSYILFISCFRATIVQGWPADGFVKTERAVDGGAIQTLWTFASGASRTYTRIWLPGGGTWGAWSGVITDAILGNAWVNFGSTRRNAGYYKGSDGRGYACGTIKSGTITAGTQLFQVPAEFRPVADHVCLNRGSGGGVGIGINAAGNVFLQSAGDATETCLDNLSWPIG